jgi:hypothetical protein
MKKVKQKKTTTTPVKKVQTGATVRTVKKRDGNYPVKIY